MTKQTKRLVYGVGVNNLNEPVKINRKVLKFYDVWKAMIRRCYSEKSHIKRPTYIGCSVCDEWLILSNFKEWFNIHYREGMELDKDIFIPGNRVYSPETCRFVPGYINSLMTDAKAIRGELPCGVVAKKPNLKIRKVNTTYEAKCCDGHGKQIRKVFKTVAEARQWYITTKTRIVREQAIYAFEANEITEDVYQALITREW